MNDGFETTSGFGSSTSTMGDSVQSTPNPSEIKKRSVVIEGHRTSISLENIFWEAARKIAAARGISVNQLITEIDSGRNGNLSSAIRTFVLQQTLSSR